MLFDYQSKEDIQKYFYNNFLKFKETGDRVFKITYIGPNSVRCTDSAGFDLWIDLKAGYNVDYVIPGRKVFSYNKIAAMLYRKPARQFNRGMHDENTGFAYLKDNGVWGNLPFDFATVESYVNKGDYCTAQNLFPWDLEHSSKAMNDQMAVTRNGHVMFGNNIIAKYDPKTKEGLVLPVYMKEVTEVFNGSGVTWRGQS
jgi:hypothetical protein